MDFTQEQLKHIANLSRLHISESELDTYTQQMGSILGYIDQLSEVDTSSVENQKPFTPHNLPLREDVVKQGIDKTELLKCSPQEIIGDQIAVRNIM